MIDVLNKPDWAGTARGAYSTGDGSEPRHYLDKLEFMGQLVARYGAQKIDGAKLETADKVSGLNYIKYFEDDNEPDYWWETPKWPAEKYAVYCNAVHDGFGVETSGDYPLLGIKSVDSTAMHVLGALAENNTRYIQKILDNSNGRIPFDVINIHTYCKDGSKGYSPENEKYGMEKNLGDFMEWCKRVLPKTPVWLTEFGWDTYADGNQHSYIYAPEQQQANYIMRSFLVGLKMGFGKAFLFMDKDPDSKNTLQYSTSGILSDKPTGLKKKPSFYYLATMQNVLGNAVLKNIVAYRKPVGNNEVYCFEFANGESETIYALWTREANSAGDKGAISDYTLSPKFEAAAASLVTPVKIDPDGIKSTLEINNNTVDLKLTETPQFVIVSHKSTSSQNIKNNGFGLRVFPNPGNGNTSISFINPFLQELNLSVYANDGSLVEILYNGVLAAGSQCFSLDGNNLSGVFLVQVTAGNSKNTEKFVMY